MPVDVKASEHRPLRFATPDELWRDVDRIVAADRARTLRSTGNWAAGQTFGHLAAWIDYAYDGYPPDLNPPWIVRTLLKLRKAKFMRGPLPRGVRIPGQKEGTKATEPLTLDDGLGRLRRAWDRLRASPPPRPNPIFGPLSHAEWQGLHLRHAELHLGYLHP